MEKLAGWIRAHLVTNAREWWKWASMRLNALGLAIMSWVWFDPTGLLAVWNMMPAPVQREVPMHVLAGIGAVLFALAMLGRLVSFGSKQ